ncbi:MULTISPECIES: SDR family NAD(P)-dependent oxidoreductase [Halomonas]|uniref:SDR family NAD(P)-dependent oxidoreductase n=1 Tax=Halomonas TaxID=2745 RepID=UPI001A8C02B1|nr:MULTISPECIES: SDR family oxidoreductase [Halomonas]MED5294915.1 SDR family oxidoreductase [Pseudomonadota bacterium]MBN8412081.1 SDR family oxidoreductase [Halomonas litopenaei]MBY5924349.1 SDR family oxidoreductase [Halomonas sp. DP4Y7-2]MBY5929941.1 SDR family oxidoreductase [Halomonas sp. DP8Y7-3]MBY5968312.1 SDR family oxidoreductase [Halomonas denitrificans]
MSMRPDFHLAGRVALVTGGSSGLGRAIGEALAASGARVVLTARRAEALADGVDVICREGGQAAALAADLADPHGLDEVARRAAEPFGEPTILVNAAGVNLRQPMGEVDLAAWELTLQLHLGTPFFLSRALVPGMRRAGYGRIINLASLQSSRAFPDSAPYGAAKGGIAQLTRAMAEAWSRHGVNANALAPGFFPTELTSPVFGDAERSEALARQTAIGRNGRLEDIAGPAVFLASPASAYVTGQILHVDGGFTAK